MALGKSYHVLGNCGDRDIMPPIARLNPALDNRYDVQTKQASRAEGGTKERVRLAK